MPRRYFSSITVYLLRLLNQRMIALIRIRTYAIWHGFFAVDEDVRSRVELMPVGMGFLREQRTCAIWHGFGSA